MQLHVDLNIQSVRLNKHFIYVSRPSLKFSADVYRIFTVLNIYIICILQINEVIIEGYVAFYA